MAKKAAKTEDEVVEDEVTVEETTPVVEETTAPVASPTGGQPTVVPQPEVVEREPCCLPQHDPSLRSPRTTEQSEAMIQVINQNS